MVWLWLEPAVCDGSNRFDYEVYSYAPLLWRLSGTVSEIHVMGEVFYRFRIDDTPVFSVDTFIETGPCEQFIVSLFTKCVSARIARVEDFFSK